MAQRWESDLDEDLQDVDLNLAIGTYGQNGIYDDGVLVLRSLNHKVLTINFFAV